MRMRLVLLAIIVVVVGVLFYRNTARLRAPQDPPIPAGSAAAADTPSPTAPPGSTGSATKPPAHATRLSKPERQAVADRIAAGRAERARQAPPQPPSLPAEPGAPDELAQVSPQLKAAFKEAIPFLAECYKTGQAADRRPAVQMTVLSDPDIGTIIDPDQMLDVQGKPLEPGLESCLRTTLESLELPALGTTAQLHLQYSFRFDDE